MAVRKKPISTHGTLLVPLVTSQRDMDSSKLVGKPNYLRFEDQSEEYTCTAATENRILLVSRISNGPARSSDELPTTTATCDEHNHIELEILDTHHLLSSPHTNRSAIVGSPLCVSVSSLGLLSPPRTGGHRVFLSPLVKRIPLENVNGGDDGAASAGSCSNIANLSTLSLPSTTTTPNELHAHHMGRSSSPPPSYIITQDITTLSLGELAVLVAELRADIDDRSQELIRELELRDQLERAGCELRHTLDELQSASSQTRRRTILKRRSSCGSRPDVYVALD
eukprot:comp74729_c0_seq1/m.48239 comp74729_c0_seq1/g.48239  ORF comp74729_c0_seq1/g.48239 comp74729_c0_seq1/m.48239 type:complete len:282 (-) comp74729_c0_seq1:94-939(-)